LTKHHKTLFRYGDECNDAVGCDKVSRNVRYWFIANRDCMHHELQVRARGSATNPILMCFFMWQSWWN